MMLYGDDCSTWNISHGYAVYMSKGIELFHVEHEGSWLNA